MRVARYENLPGGVAVALLCAIALFLLAPSSARADTAVVVIDGSRSMWGQIDGAPKYLMIHQAFADIMEREPAPELSLVAFGNRSPSSCSDIHVLARAGDDDAEDFLGAIERLRPWGMTPISGALERAADLLGDEITSRRILLITDGTENCRRDPCAAAAALKSADAETIIDVIAIAATPGMEAQLSCIADATGGAFHNVSDAAGLESSVTAFVDALNHTPQQDMQEAPVATSGETPAEEEQTASADESLAEEPAATEEQAPVAIVDGPLVNDPSSADRLGMLPEYVIPPPPALALEGADPPVPQLNPRRRDEVLAYMLPLENPLRDYLVAETEEPIVVDPDPGEADEPLQFADMDEPLQGDALEGETETGEAPELAELDGVDGIETGSIPQDGSATSPEQESQQGEDIAARAQEPDASDSGRGGTPEFDVTTEPQAQTQGLRLRAKLTSRLQPITRALEWTVYKVTGDDPALWPQMVAVREAEPEITLDAGEYMVEARYGYVTASKPLKVVEGTITDATFVLNAGGLRVLSQLVYVDSPLQEPAIHFIYSAEKDENGMRRLVARSELQGEIIRLNAGNYHLISRLGTANSVVETEVEVHPGVLTAVEVNHKAGILTLLAQEEQGDGGEEVTFEVQDETGVVVAQIDGRIGHAVLAPGTYIVVAESNGRTDIQQFQIRIGEVINLDLQPE